jgi:ATP-dependent Clp protease ATP-binding subunit ClpC
MFERYTEKARRVVFFARYEASQFGMSYIETEHILLGLLREDKALTNRILRTHASVESIRKQIEAHATAREKIATSVDLPLSNDCKRVLAYAAEEAERLGHKHIGTEHLVLGLLREETCFAAELLKERGVKLEIVREELSKEPHVPESRTPPAQAEVSDSFRDLTREAAEGNLTQVVGREIEVDAVIEILAASRNRNPLHIGEHGCGKRAIAEALAQRIANGTAPSFLAGKRIMAFEPQAAAIPAREFVQFAEELRKKLDSFAEESQVILLVRDFLGPVPRGSVFGPLAHVEILKPAILRGGIQCIAACTPSDYAEFWRSSTWMSRCFRAVHVRPLAEEETLAVLKARKPELEKFHEVSFDDQALEVAANSASRYLPDRALPGKAIELLDAAAARVKLRHPELPAEVIEVQKRIRFIMQRMDSAIASHEFEKARFYSDEEKKERENLRVLHERHHVDEGVSNFVKGEDVEAVIRRWSEYPYQP